MMDSGSTTLAPTDYPTAEKPRQTRAHRQLAAANEMARKAAEAVERASAAVAAEECRAADERGWAALRIGLLGLDETTRDHVLSTIAVAMPEGPYRAEVDRWVLTLPAPGGLRDNEGASAAAAGVIESAHDPTGAII